ncbi:hypothetical protein DRQ25_15535 [Candidatus Fermentibacteria bacterium]|nr:MAG: hypothetical protein DRQ25_15535 [Candidatus Fermentibacteria bacterium]
MTRRNEYDPEYYLANREKILKQRKDYYERNKERIREWHKNYRAEYRDLINAQRMRNYYKKKARSLQTN